MAARHAGAPRPRTPRALLALCFALVAWQAPRAAAAQAPTPRLSAPPRAAVEAAIHAPLTRHNRHIPGGAHTNMGHRDEAPVVLALAASAGDRSADARLLEQMRYTLTGGNDITANGGYPAQHDRYVTVMYAIARRTPRIWSRLTDRERHAVDLLMTASFVSNAFTTSDHNPFILAGTQQYALDGDDNLNRDWNPNYREGMVGGVLVGVVYFGGPERAQAVLDSYDHAAFVDEVARAGLDDVHETFTWKASHPESGAPTGEMIERAIRDYRYKGLSLRDYMEIYGRLTEDTYGKTVECGLDGGRGVRLPDGTHAGRLLSGCEGLPNRGKPGMLKELDSVDAGGPRSSTTYAYSGFSINLVNQIALIVGGYWTPGPVARDALARLRVGVPDLWYKLDHGYRNYSKGHAQGEVRGGGAYGVAFSRPLWEEVVLPYHLSARPASAPSSAAPGALAWPAVTRDSRPWTRWWWLGSAVDSANLTRELRGLAEAGFGGVEVTSIYGVHGREADFVPYLSDRWIQLLLHAAGEARKNGMGLDLPPGSGWRMGGPDVPLDEASVSLRLHADTVQGREVWHAEIRNNGEKVKRPGPGGEGNAIDVLSRSAVEDYLNAFGQRFAAVPRGTIGSFFHDSYEYTGTASRGFFQAFSARRGYDLKRYLPALAGQGDPDLVARVKSDYRETMSDLLRENLLEPFTAWAHREGSQSRNQAHGSPANILDLYAASDIPETEIFGPLGGSDSDPLVSKFASSAAHVAGKPLASSESMTWLAEHFTETLDQVKRAVDQLFVSGINHLVYHGTAYSPSDAAWPGWLFYASTEFNPRNAIWHDLPALNRYVTRVQSVLQSGTPDNDLLVYWPVYDSWHDPAGLRMDFRVHDPAWLHEKPVGAVARTLWAKGYGFDYVSDRLLDREVKAAPGRVSASGAEYAAVLVPHTLHMPDSTMSRLVDLANGGATVLFVEALPADVPGAGDLEARRARLRAAEARLTLGAPDGAGVRSARVGAGRVLVGGSPEALLRTAGIARESMVDHPGVRYLRRRFDGGWHYFIANGGTGAVDGWVPLAVGAGAVEIMDPMSGETGMARTRSASGGTEVQLHLDPGQSVILRAFRAPVAGPGWPYRRAAGPARPLRGSWEVRFLQGGPTLPAPFRTDSLGSWTARGPEAERFAGTARYTLRFDAPDGAADYLLDLGDVAESARVRLNGKELGTLLARPYRLRTGPLRRTGNVLEVEVTNLSANRIRDLDRRGVQWKIFYDINFVGIDYKPFDASQWPVRPSGLLGPVSLQPIANPITPPPSRTSPPPPPPSPRA